MDEVITTILFDGRFYIALIEKIDSHGELSVGRYIFGPEPTNTDLLRFYLFEYCLVKTGKSPIKIRVKKKRSLGEQERSVGKSREVFSAIQARYLGERAKVEGLRRKDESRERFAQRQEKKQRKRKGH